MKKQNYLVVCLLLLFSFKIFADKPKVKGYYINNNGDSIPAMIIVYTGVFNKDISVYNFQFALYIDQKGKEVKITQHDALRFGFVYQGEKYVFHMVKEVLMPVWGNMHPTGTFLRLLKSGPCNLYSAIFTSSDSRGGSRTFYEFLIKKDNGEYHLSRNTYINDQGRDLDLLFADCPALVAKIKAKEYKKDDEKYAHMVDYYNQNCGSQPEKSDEE